MNIQLKNFASFVDSGHFRIDPGLNVFLGINNAGKSALLTALSMLSASVPKRRSEVSKMVSKLNGYARKAEGGEGLQNVVLNVSFELPPRQRDALISALCKSAGNERFPPFEETRERLSFTWVYNPGQNFGFVEPVEVVSRRGQFPIFLSARNNSYALRHPFGFQQPNTWSPPEHEVTPVGGDGHGRQIWGFSDKPNPLGDCWATAVSNVITLSSYRLPETRQKQQAALTLEPNASNLTQVLGTAQLTTLERPDARDQFDRVLEAVRRIFPEIRGIRTASVDADLMLVVDLKRTSGVPLSHCGSGVQQVLILLLATFLAPPASLILIDEPHTYLHPAAERHLVRFLDEVGKERDLTFCVTTHSSILASNTGSRLFAVVLRPEGSKVAEINDVRGVLEALEITPGDLFTYDKVLFVEGPSDVTVFRDVLDHFDREGATCRTKIVALSGDGKFRDRKSAARVGQLLIDASASKIGIPVGFIFDLSGRSDQDKQDLERALSHPRASSVRFLRLGELEDYLLCKEAICEVLRDDARMLTYTLGSDFEAKVALRIAEGGKASTVLSDCFGRTITGHSYKKAQDAGRICKAILRMQPEFLDSLASELMDFAAGLGRTDLTAGASA
jgi:predicted ATPase